MQNIGSFIQNVLHNLHIPSIHWSDVVEIIIISFLLYHLLRWIKSTRAWTLLKGLLVIAAFVFFAFVFQMNTILWIVTNLFSIAAIAIVVVLQPELRKALETLGNKSVLNSILPIDTGKVESGHFSDKTVNEIVRAAVIMGKAKTGALIVIQKTQSLSDYERTGIDVDALVTSQLLINIFEHNTPLHDGAVIISGDRIKAATCYLPLSDNMSLSKELGTRHRAGVGISEVTDSLTVIVSEETGKISVAYLGSLERNLDADKLSRRLLAIQDKQADDKKNKIKHWKGKVKNEE